MRAVIKFSKSEAVKYISHLDVLRMFQRALMRSGLKTAYSEGYHPHMLLSFALAAPVGVASSCEYAEVYFEYPMFCEEIKQRLGATMPGGCEVLVAAADYQFYYKPEESAALARGLLNLNEQPEIIIMKKSKKGPKPADIKPMLYRMEMHENILECSLASGGTANLRPDALDDLLFEKTGVKAEQIFRTALYIEQKGERIRPEQAEGRI